MPTLALENLSKTFPKGRLAPVVAVDRLNLAIEEGELLVLVGPSGCGKTTVLRLLAGLEKPSGGAVLLDGANINHLEPQDRGMAMVFQSPALFPHMTVFENLAFALKLQKLPAKEIESRVRGMADLLGLSQRLAQLPEFLSGGEKQRVGLGRALAQRPRALLLDEPLSNLDPGLRTQMRREIARLHAELRCTMVYATHDQTEAMTLGGRIAVLKEGALQQVASPRELWRSPATRFVAGFLGNPPMNFFEGRLIREDGTLRFVTESGQVWILPASGQANDLPDSCLKAPVVLGIRPHQLLCCNASGSDPSSQAFAATVELLEPLGAETFAILGSPGLGSFTGRLADGWEARRGDAALVVPNFAGALLYDSSGGQLLHRFA